MPETLRCDPKLFEKDLSDQVIIVTGANSGVGLDTAKQLAKQNATVILGCRSEEKGKKTEADINGEEGVTKGKAVFVTTMDLASLTSIREFVTAFQSQYTRLDALINNAGIACPLSRTKEGFEMQMGANHLGHFLLMRLLTPLLLQTAEDQGKPSRFIALSSVAAAAMSMNKNFLPDIHFDDLNYETRKFKSLEAYGESKLANYLHAMEAGKRYPNDKLISTSVHPGFVVSNLGRDFVESMLGKGFLANSMIKSMHKFYVWKGDAIYPFDGCQTSLYCVLEDADKMESGKFYSQFGIYADKECQKGGWPMDLPNKNATSEKAEKLWEMSDKLVGMSPSEEEEKK